MDWMTLRAGNCWTPTGRSVAAGLIWIASWASIASIAFAQDSITFPADASDEELSEVVVPLSDAVRKQIAKALATQQATAGQPGTGQPGTGQPTSTGDPVLDDVLNVIRRQGSVLDGSRLQAVPVSPPQLPAARYPGGVGDSLGFPDSSGTPSTSSPGTKMPPVGPLQSATEMRFYVAESLLRAARELAALPDSDAQRRQLIASMREQATVLMIDEFAPVEVDINR